MPALPLPISLAGAVGDFTAAAGAVDSMVVAVAGVDTPVVVAEDGTKPVPSAARSYIPGLSPGIFVGAVSPRRSRTQSALFAMEFAGRTPRQETPA
jgi:hypothetical protein